MEGQGKGSGRPPSNSSSSDNGWNHPAEHYALGPENVLLNQMARLVLRHEHQLQAIQQDMKLHLFLRPDLLRWCLL